MTSSSGRGWRNEARDDPSLSEILYVLKSRRLLVVGAVLAGIALLFGLFRGPVYTAEARVSVLPQGKLEGEEARPRFPRRSARSVVTQEMLSEVRRRAGWEAGPKAFSERLIPRPSPAGTAVRGCVYGSPATSRGRRPGGQRYAEVRRRGSRNSATGRWPTA